MNQDKWSEPPQSGVNQPHGSYHFGVVQTKISGSYQEKVVFTSNVVRTTLLVQTTCSWFKPEIQVQTSQSGVNHEAGSYHLFLVCTGKVVQTTKQWYEPSVVQTTLGWSGPLFLVQTTKTWSIPSFFRRLLSSVSGTPDRMKHDVRLVSPNVSPM